MTCYEYGDDKCVTCQSSYYLEDSVCVEACSSSSYPDELTGTCKKCNIVCEGCVAKGLVSSSVICLSECPSGTFSLENYYTKEIECIICDKSCKKCLGKIFTFCLLDIKAQILLNV